MNEVFVSYKREDQLRVLRIVRALEKSGLSVWWDRHLPAGLSWRAEVDSALANARCVVVVWTHASIDPLGSFVLDEATRGASRRVLVPVLLDRVQPPLGFGELQAVDLVDWRGSSRDPFFQDLTEAIRAKIDRSPAPAARGPLTRLTRRLTLSGLASSLVLAGFAFGTDSLGLQQKACALPVGQPRLSDLCGAFGLGKRPTAAERIAWEKRPDGDCNFLRQHIHEFPNGAYRDTATALLDARTQVLKESYRPRERRLSLFVGSVAAPTIDEAAAREVTLRSGRKDAERLCTDFATSGLFVYRAAEVEVDRWDCRAERRYWTCRIEGHAECLLDERETVTSERCDSAGSTVGIDRAGNER